MVVTFSLFVIGFSKDRIVVVVITVHIIIGFLVLLVFPFLLLVVSEIEEPDSTTRLEGSQVGEIRLQRSPLRGGARSFLGFGVFQDSHFLQLALKLISNTALSLGTYK